MLLWETSDPGILIALYLLRPKKQEMLALLNGVSLPPEADRPSGQEDLPVDLTAYPVLERFAKQSFRPNSALCSKFYPWNIDYVPVVKFFACLDFERKSTFCKRLLEKNFLEARRHEPI
jgi:hypothetical protein